MPIVLVDVSGGFIIIKYSVLRTIGITITNIVTLQVTSAGLHQTLMSVTTAVANMMTDIIFQELCCDHELSIS